MYQAKPQRVFRRIDQRSFNWPVVFRVVIHRATTSSLKLHALRQSRPGQGARMTPNPSIEGKSEMLRISYSPHVKR